MDQWKIDNKGFTLLEVMIAMTIFAVFITAFVAIQGNNLLDSSMMREEATLQRLCINKINELTLHPPAFSEALTLTPETKTFEDFPNYQYTITYKRLEIPEFNKIQGINEEDSGEVDNNQAIEKRIYDQVAKIIKEAMWQVEVVIENKDTGYKFSLATWLRNKSAKVEINP